MNTRQKLTLGIAAIFMVTLTIVGVTYAYFVTRVTGDTTESIRVQTANIGDLEYGDGNGIASLDNVLPGATVYKSFTVTNKGANEQPFSIFLSSTEPGGTYTTTVNGEEFTYTRGAFLHGNGGKNAGIEASCYDDSTKRSAEEGADTTNCFVAGALYNNIRVTVYQLSNNTLQKNAETGAPILGENGSVTLVETDVLAAYDFENLSESDISAIEAGSKVVNRMQIHHNDRGTGKDFLSQTDYKIPGATRYNYVMKVEYLDTAVETAETDEFNGAVTDDNNQNAENLAALNIKVDISE